MNKKQYYDTEVEASTLLQEQRSIAEQKSCPVFRTICYGANCMSFAPGALYSTNRYDLEAKKSKLQWSFNPASCESPLVTGYIDWDMQC